MYLANLNVSLLDLITDGIEASLDVLGVGDRCRNLKKFYASPRSIYGETSNEREGIASSYP